MPPFFAHGEITPKDAFRARKDLLRDMPPFFGGGEMIREVRFDGTTYADPPHRFEAGTPNIAGFVGLGAAIDYMESLGREPIAAYEHDLLEYATAAMRTVPGLRIFGEAKNKASVISFL